MQEIFREMESLREETKSYFDALHSESDRGHALISISQLENVLKVILSTKFLHDHKETRQLFKRPLRSFAARIDFAFCLGLIDSNIHRELHTLRDIRNDFAHTFTDLSFECDVISENIDKLKFSLDRGASTRREKFASSVLSSFMVLLACNNDATPPEEKDLLEPSIEGMSEIVETIAMNVTVMRELEKMMRDLDDDEMQEA